MIVRAPATTANMGPGFDTFGMALKLYNRFEFTLAEQNAVSLLPGTCVEIPEGLLTDAPGNNLLFIAAKRLYDALGQPCPPLSIGIEAHIPLARGLGSSSSAIAAGLVAANTLSGASLPVSTLVNLATQLEGHPDNVAPCLLGGAWFCDEDGNTEGEENGPAVTPYPLPWPEAWAVVAVIPPYPLATETARAAIPKHYSLRDAIFNLRKCSVLTYALLTADAVALSQALADRLHHPYRGPLIAEFDAVSQVAKRAGAYGTVISGAGSSMLTIAPSGQVQSLVKQLQSSFPTLKTLALAPDTQGTHVIQ